MNPSMARMTKDAQIFNTVVLMAFIYVMNVQAFLTFAYETFVGIVSKCTLSVVAAPFSVISIAFSRSLKSMKNFLFTDIRTIFRRILSTMLSFIFFSTDLARLLNFSIIVSFMVTVTFPRTERNFAVFTFRNIARPHKEISTAVLASNFNFIIPRTFITSSRTINGSPFFKCGSTGWAYFFHMPSLTLATVKVNKKPEVSNAREI